MKPDCPSCQAARTHVRASSMSGGRRRRYHECRACGHRFTTWDWGAPVDGTPRRRVKQEFVRLHATNPQWGPRRFARELNTNIQHIHKLARILDLPVACSRRRGAAGSKVGVTFDLPDLARVRDRATEMGFPVGVFIRRLVLEAL